MDGLWLLRDGDAKLSVDAEIMSIKCERPRHIKHLLLCGD
jgi:hypothetical protein